MSDYPEHEKLAAVRAQSQAIGEFVDWLAEQGVQLCRQHEHTDDCYPDPEVTRWPVCGLGDGEWFTDVRPITDRLAAFFEIDQRRLEEEKRAMLDELRHHPR